jgi:hypothetical protein
MARAFRGKLGIPRDQMAAYFQTLTGPLHENQGASGRLTVIPLSRLIPVGHGRRAQRQWTEMNRATTLGGVRNTY